MGAHPAGSVAREIQKEIHDRMSKIYVTGGELRRSVFRKLEEWQSSQKALIIELDLDKKTSRTCVEYVSPANVCSPDLPAIVFKSASLAGSKFYACTSTEVLVYQLPAFRLLHYISLPCFNDLHHVCPTARGTLLIAVTGLDLVVEVTTSGELVREWSVLGEDTWARFSRKVDYRRVPTTKPHLAHPNHVFQLEDEIWVTRLEQRDAISLSQPGRRIDIAVQRPHDGHLFNHSIYFTTVDGHIIVVNRQTLNVETAYDLTRMSGSTTEALGWCRGLIPLNQGFLWVGFTRIRPTKFRENLSWLKSGGFDEQVRRPTHLALYDLQRATCVDEILLEPHGIGVVFSLLPGGD
jgi:hypothetical protein